MEKKLLDKLAWRGEVEITAECQETGMIRKVRDDNVLVEMLKGLGGSTYNWGHLRMRLWDRRLAKNSLGLCATSTNVREHTSRLSRVFAPLTGRDADDWYVEEIFRFDATGNTEEVNSIYLTHYYTTGIDIVDASIGLDQTFVQGASDLLSIKYRFVLNTSTLTEIEAFQVSAIFKWAFDSTSGYHEKDFMPGYFTPEYRSVSPYLNLEHKSQMGYEYNGGNGPNSSGYTFDVEKSDKVGWYFSGVGYLFTNNVEDPVTGDSGDHAANFNTICSPDNHEAFVNYPLGPLFNHGPEALHCFEDIDNLATGIGYPIISSPSTPSWAMGDDFRVEAQRFNITRTGNVGTARYEIAIEPISSTGLDNNTVVPRTSKYGQHATGIAGVSSSRTDIVDHVSLKNPATHPIGHAISEYNSKYMYHFDLNGNGDIAVCLVNKFNVADVIGFDTMTTPALPSGIGVELDRNYIKRNEVGDIFIPTLDGYAVIRDPLGTPTVEIKTLASIGVTSRIKGIDINGDLIQVVTVDGFAYSLDDGVTWTSYSTPSTIGTAYHVNLIGGDINNPTLVIIMQYNADAEWLDGSTGTLSHICNNVASVSYGDGWFDADAGLYKVVWRESYYSKMMSLILLPGETKDAVYYTSTGQSGSQNINNYFGYYKLIRDRLNNWVMATIQTAVDAEVLLHYADDTRAVAPIQFGNYNTMDSNWYRVNNNCRTHIYDEYDGIVDYHYGKFTVLRDYSHWVDFWAPGDSGSTDKSNENATFGLLPYYSKIHRWDNSANTWKSNWNASTPATSAGSFTGNGDRIGFATDSNIFNGSSSVDISTGLNSTSYAAGISLAVLVTEDITGLGTFATDWREVNDSPTCPVRSVLSIRDTASTKGITLLHRGYDNNVMLLDNTDSSTTVVREVSLGVPATDVETRYILTIDPTGTSVKVYANGAQIGATISLTEALPLNGTLEGSIGSGLFGIHGVPAKVAGFVGELNNILVYSSVMSSSQVTSDATVPDGLLVTSNLVARFLMNADYSEGKVTHGSSEVNLFDLSVRFDDGDLSSDSYVEGDNYFTTKAAYGYVEDNATTRSLTVMGGMTHSLIDECTSPISGTSTIPAADGVIGTHLLPFAGSVRAGFGMGVVPVPSWSSPVDTYTAYPLSGDVVFEFEEATPDASSTVNVITSGYEYSSLGSSHAEYHDLITLAFAASGDVTIEGTIISGTREVNRKWRIAINSSANTYSVGYYNDSNVYVPAITDALSSADMSQINDGYYLRVESSAVDFFSLNNVTGSGTLDRRILRMGDRDTGTGSYSPKFRTGLTNTGARGSLKITINGVEQSIDTETTHSTVRYMTGIYSSAAPSTEPPVGTVRYTPGTGVIEVNSAEIGKSIKVMNVPVDIADVILD